MKKLFFASIVLLASLFLLQSETASAVTDPADCGPGNWRIESGVCIPTGTGLPDPDQSYKYPLQPITENFLRWFLGFFGFIAIIGFIISGIQYLTAAGNEDQASKAKRNMTWSIVGVIVGLLGYIIVVAVDNLLNSRPLF